MIAHQWIFLIMLMIFLAFVGWLIASCYYDVVIAPRKVDEENEKRSEAWRARAKDWDMKANRCVYCKCKYLPCESEKRCSNCGATLPKWQHAEPPPFEIVLR